ncbi:MAG: VOC family protein [Luteitalea sp.]
MTALPFEHLALNVSDPVAVADWYVRHVGMEVVRKGEPPVQMHFLADAARVVLIELYVNPSAPVDGYAAMHPLQLHLAFTSADPDADTARLVAAGASLVEHLRQPDGSHLVMLRDPWGLPIQLARRTVPML